MISNLLSQLKDAKQLDKFEQVLAEVPKVREEMGYPPLVTPLSQMVGTQAVMNVLSGERYKLIPNEIKDYVKGYYGKSPGPISEEVRQKVIGNDTDVITVRPADLLKPSLEQFEIESKAFATSMEDVLSYALFPQIATPFLKKKKDPFYDIPEQNVTIII
ncbi:hypothetical protein [Erysipelothrix inopinata]|nr:hypothetical protein [Erysipelothrix inopinata]